MKAYSVTFTNDGPGPGRRHDCERRSAVVVAEDVMQAGQKSILFLQSEGAKGWPKGMYVEEIRLDDDLVIL